MLRLSLCLLLLGGVAGGTLRGQSAAGEAPPPSAREAAWEAFAAGSYAQAAPLFAQWREEVPPEAAAAEEARALELLCERLVRLERRPWDEAATDWLEENAAALDRLARSLRERAGRQGRDDAAWRRVYEAIGLKTQLEVNGRSPLGELLAFWGNSTELERARQEYVRLVRALASDGRVRGRLRTTEGREWLQNAARVAREPADVASLHLELAQSYPHYYQANPEFQVRRGEALRRAVDAGSGTEVYAEALFELGSWAQRFGEIRYDERGERIFLADYEQAIAAYEALLETRREDWARWRNRARAAIEDIRRPALEVLVSHAFRPETEVQFAVRWRNLEAPQLEVYRFDPLAAEWLDNDGRRPAEPPPPLPDAAVAFEATPAERPAAPHYAVLERIRLGQSLPPGAYAVVARAGEEVAWASLSVTDLVVVSHTVGRELVAFVADAATGAPQSGLELRFEQWLRPRGESAEEATVEVVRGTTNDNGLWTTRWPEGFEGRRSWHLVASDPASENG
ncbi:MAG: hypothetical protein ACLFU2_03695, partial [Opitutales bacterium]